MADELKDQNINDIMTFEGRILEMSSDTESVNVGVHPDIDVSTLTADDPNPKFVNVEIIRTGISKTNRRRYNSMVVREISNMTPGVQGFLGHPDPSKHGFEFREPQCIFVGSIVQEMADGNVRSVAKAYLFKTSPLREWIPKSIASRRPMTVSINGTGDIMRSGEILDVLHMNDLESIDWANPGTEGMGTSQAISVVNEMQNSGGGSNMEAKDIIKNTTIAEFKSYNLDGYNNMIRGISITELQTLNPELFGQIKETGKITEMQLNVDGSETKNVKLTEFQGILDTKNSEISTLNDKIVSMEITEFKNSKINELIPENLRETVSKRVTGRNKQEIEQSITNEIAYIREMTGGFDNMPAGNTHRKTDGDMESQIKSLFGVREKK